MEPQQTTSQYPRKLHRQIETLIRQFIAEKQLKPGDQLPTEADLCLQFHVSRSTVRLALMQLERAGLITRTPGRGTFVRQVSLPPDPSELSTASRQHRGRSTRRTRPTASQTVGVVMSFAGRDDTQHVMQMSILLGIEHAVKSRRYNTFFVRTDEYDEAGEAKAIQDIQNAGMAGLIVLPIANHTTTSGVKALIEQQVPVVLVDRYLSALDTCYVISDNFRGAYRVTEHLIALGYQHFEFVLPLEQATLEEQLATTSIRGRYEGYCKALQDYGLADRVREPCVLNVFDPAALHDLLATSRSESGLPIAIVALHDLIAIPLMNTAAKVGLKPPRDFAIVGFDDLPFCVHLPVPLTSVTQPRYEIGFRAGHMLIDKIEGNPIRNNKLSLMVATAVRESCGAHVLVRQRLAVNAH